MITQGEWYMTDFAVLVQFPDENFLIADLDQSNRPDNEVEANARLIAAAPELLAACENIAWTANKVANGGLKQPGKREKIGDLKQAIRDLRDTANAAIEAAEGVL